MQCKPRLTARLPAHLIDRERHPSHRRSIQLAEHLQVVLVSKHQVGSAGTVDGCDASAHRHINKRLTVTPPLCNRSRHLPALIRPKVAANKISCITLDVTGNGAEPKPDPPATPSTFKVASNPNNQPVSPAFCPLLSSRRHAGGRNCQHPAALLPRISMLLELIRRVRT
eukprot:365911-Chlamydomonas_euryale.AAC.2